MRSVVTHRFGAGAGFAHLETDSDDTARVHTKLGFEECNVVDVYRGQ
ncbi:MAG: hypothetical protein ABSF89_12065 [Acidimicrobiales bacterium]